MDNIIIISISTIDWRWSSKYNQVPLIKDLSEYLFKNDIMIQKNELRHLQLKNS